MAQPSTSIFLCSIPYLDETYEHTVNFQSEQNQKNWFGGMVQRRFENCYYNRKDYTINLPVNVDEIQHCNYLFYRNNIDMKTYYCFIIESEYVSENNCKIYFDIDVLQTYMFDYHLVESFIEKCHSQRWKNVNGIRVPYHNTNPEGLDYGLVVQHDVIPLLNYDDNYVICSSVPIGKLTQGGGSGGTGGGTCDKLPTFPENSRVNASQKEFLQSLWAGCVSSYTDNNLFCSINMAQACLESGWGKSALATESHNLYGIKADSSWTGEKKEYPTNEVVNGETVQVMAWFRVYPNNDASVQDHTKFLKENPRYTEAGVFSAKTPREQADALVRAGYATDPGYANQLMEFVDGMNFKVYDIKCGQ